MKDEYFILPKALYFVFNIMNYCLHSVQNQLIESRWDLNMKQIAFTNMLEVSSFFGSLFWTQFADSTGYFKTIIAVSCLVFGIMWGALFIPSRFIITENERILLVCTVITMTSFFRSSLFPILDAVGIGYISRTGKFSKELFGRQRFWGAAGHFVTTGISVYMSEKFGFDSLFYLLEGSCIILFFIIVLGIPNDLNLEVSHGHHHGPPKDEKKKSEKEDTIQSSAQLISVPIAPVAKKQSPFKILMTKPSFLFFLLFIMLAGITRSIMTSYQNYYVDRKFARTYFLAFLATVRFFSEGCVYFFNQDLAKFLGFHWMLILSQVAGAMRSIGYGMVGLVPNHEQGMWYLCCIPLELFKGLNSGLVTAGAVRLASDLAPPGGANTAQGLFTGVFIGLSTFLGGAFTYFLIDSKKIEKSLSLAFNLSGGALLIFTIIFIAKYALVDKVILVSSKNKKASLSK